MRLLSLNLSSYHKQAGLLDITDNFQLSGLSALDIVVKIRESSKLASVALGVGSIASYIFGFDPVVPFALFSITGVWWIGSRELARIFEPWAIGVIRDKELTSKSV